MAKIESPWTSKDPADRDVLRLSWRRHIGEDDDGNPTGDRIDQFDWTLPDGIAEWAGKRDVYDDGLAVTVGVAGGEDGEVYVLTCFVTTDHGRELHRHVALQVRRKVAEEVT